MIGIIIIDDEEMIRKGLVHTINWLSMGITVLGSTDNGQDGMEMIRRLRPDIVLTDIKMPLMDGLEMVKKLKGQVEFKVVFLTSYQEFEFAQQAIKLNAVDYLLKPIEENVLEELMLKIVAEIKESKKYEKLKKVTNANQQNVDEWLFIRYAQEGKTFYIKETLDYIEKNYNKKISLGKLANQCNVSESYMRRILRKYTGKTFVELLHLYRINKSIEYLKEGNLRINEISDICGFSDYKHFYSVFKKKCGLSPTDFYKKVDVIKNE